MNIAIYIASFNSGGAEKYLLRFLKIYHRESFFTIYFSGTEKDHLYNEYKKLDIRIKYVKLNGYNLFYLLNFSKELKKEKYDVYCDFSNFSAFIGLLSAKIARIKKRIVFYRTDRINNSAPFHYKFVLNMYAYLIPFIATKVLSNSKSAIQNYYQLKSVKNPNKYLVIKNGLNVDEFISSKNNLRNELKIPENAFVVGNIARYDYAKNHDSMIQVALELTQNYKDIYFIFCGKNIPEKYKSIVEDNNNTQILLLPNTNQVIDVLNTLDFFMFMSLYEGHPNALMEAMALKKPFVASNIPTILEITPLNVKSQLVAPLSLQDIRKKIEDFYKDREYSRFEFLEKYIRQNYAPKDKFNVFYNVLTGVR